MTNIYVNPEKLSMKTRLFRIAEQALIKEGWEVASVPGSGKGSVRRITRASESLVVTIRTTQDQWIAFPRDLEDKKWVTLSEVDAVVAVSVDDRDAPRNAWVHLFDGDDIRDRFDRSYAARRKAGHSIPVGRGVWVGLYEKEADEPPSFVGAGAGLVTPAFAVVPLNLDEDPLAVPTQPGLASQDSSVQLEEAPLTIAEAKRRLALTFGVEPSNVKITIEA